MRRITIPMMAAVLLGGCVPKSPAAIDPKDIKVFVPKPVSFSAQQRGLCQSGCVYIPGPGITDDEVIGAMKTVASTKLGDESEALDKLLFYDEDVRRVLASGEKLPLSAEWEAALRHEIAKRAAYFELKVVDDDGVVRAIVPKTLMTLGVKRHMDTEENVRVQPINANGTLVRVGLNHIWYRM